MRTSVQNWTMLLLGLVGFACAAEEPEVRQGSLLVENKSQYVLEELRFHQGSDYSIVNNQLSRPLAVDASYTFWGVSIWYVTAYREQYRDGPIFAFTTGLPIELKESEGLKLEVFDDSFRLSPSPYLMPTLTSSTSSTSSSGLGLIR